MYIRKEDTTQNGYIMIVGIIFLAIILSLCAILLQYVSSNAKTIRSATAQTQALQLAEAGIDVAVSKLNQNPSYSGETNTVLGDGKFTTTVVTVDSQTRAITATGNATFKGKASTKSVRVTVSINPQVLSFRYRVQAGSGGFIMSGGSTINGNVYSNGSINATTGVTITGSATAANQPAVAADQTNDLPATIGTCTGSTCVNFGNTAATQDFAQSFKLNSALPLNNIQFFLKKTGNPGNLTVRIVNDSGAGSPSTTQLMSGTIASSAVTTSFGWITVSLPATPILDPSENYWMILDDSTNASNYYSIGANNNVYANGVPKIGAYSGTWNATSPATIDGYFRIYLGGGTSMIGGNTYVNGVNIGTAGTDEAWAQTVMGATVSGPLYCQTSSYTNKACNTSRAASPSPQSLPISDNNISDWKDDATAGGVYAGDYTVGYAGATIGPKHITGNLTVGGGGTLTVTGTLWIDGNIIVSGGGKIQLAAAYGANSGVIVNDGYVNLTGGSNFAGSGTAGSYPFVITTSACPASPDCAGNDAIYLSGGAGTVALIGQNGNVRINGGSSLKAVTGKQITMDGGATLYYDSGLISENFYSGPGGSWEFIPGSYAIID